MALSCNFCLSKIEPDKEINVKQMMIDKNPGIVQFQTVLKIVFGFWVEATDICQLCFDSVMSHYTFREKVCKNLKIRTEGSETHPVQAQVKTFLSKINEPTSIVISQDVLSIVPNSLKRRYNSNLLLEDIYSPSVVINDLHADEIERMKQELKNDKTTTELIDGIFGDDDFYVTQNLLTEIPSTSKTTRKRAPRVEETINNQHHNDEDLDTSGESSYEDPAIPTISTKRKALKPIKRRTRKARVVKEEIEKDPLVIKTEQCSDDLSKPRRSNKCNPARLKKEKKIYSSLTNEQAEKFKELVKQSHLGYEMYKCIKCNKSLNSRHAICYHIKHLHILKEKSKTTSWVSEKVKEGKREINVNGMTMVEWHCGMCQNVKYLSHQAMRAHVTLHYNKFIKIDEMEQPNEDLPTRLPNSSLTKQQNYELNALIENSHLDNDDNGSCNNSMTSKAEILFHIKHHHINDLKDMKSWIKHEIQEGKRKIIVNGETKLEWHCTMCENLSYINRQKLREHLKSHYEKLVNSEELN